MGFCQKKGRGWNFQSSIKSTRFLKRNLTEYIAILFLAGFIGLLPLIISPNPILQPRPVGVEKPAESHWDYCGLGGAQRELDSNH